MSAGQSSGTGAMSELEDEKVTKNDIPSNRDKSQRTPDKSLDGKSVQIDEYKDNSANRRPPSDDSQQPGVEEIAAETTKPSSKTDEVDGSRSRHLSAKVGLLSGNPSKGAIRHADYHCGSRSGQACFSSSCR
jgi:hypothetical protein